MDSDLRLDQRNDEIRVLWLEPANELQASSDMVDSNTTIHCRRQVVSLKAFKSGQNETPCRPAQAQYAAVQDLWGQADKLATYEPISEGTILGFLIFVLLTSSDG
jgi:hypothetical protein